MWSSSPGDEPESYILVVPSVPASSALAARAAPTAPRSPSPVAPPASTPPAPTPLPPPARPPAQASRTVFDSATPRRRVRVGDRDTALRVVDGALRLRQPCVQFRGKPTGDRPTSVRPTPEHGRWAPCPCVPHARFLRASLARPAQANPTQSRYAFHGSSGSATVCSPSRCRRRAPA
jgi:pyruvate/2-oxoglutarate dehydrogenase complex dihydrolipoamide acyltransferase (E2) component